MIKIEIKSEPEHCISCSECGLTIRPGNFDGDTAEPSKCFNCRSRKYKLKQYFCCNSCGFKTLRGSRFQHLHQIMCDKVEKPFICTSCDYKCVTQSALTDHLVMHIGGDPFPCSICKYRTSSKENLEEHVVTMHKPLCCTVCDYRCATRPTLSKHLKTHGETKDKLRRVAGKMIHKNNRDGLKHLQTVKLEEVDINDF